MGWERVLKINVMSLLKGAKQINCVKKDPNAKTLNEIAQSNVEEFISAVRNMASASIQFENLFTNTFELLNQHFQNRSEAL